MELINKKHDEIVVSKRLAMLSYISFHSLTEVQFSSRAVDALGLRVGSYIHFLNDADDWYFYNNKDEDGFKLCNTGRYNVAVCNKALVQLFMKRTKCSYPVKFPLSITNAEAGGVPVIKIEINKPIEKVGTRNFEIT